MGYIINPSELENTPPAVASENNAALSKANDNVKTISTETDPVNSEKNSPVTKRPDGKSNVTIVGTDHQAKIGRSKRTLGKVRFRRI